MPNWTTNHLQITGDVETMAPIVEKIRATGGNEFSFQWLLPVPQELADTRSPVRIDPDQVEPTRSELAFKFSPDDPDVMQVVSLSLAEAERRNDLYGATEWYSWSLENWGTKWDACHVQHAAVLDDGTIQTAFDTAWDAPRAFIEHLRRMGLLVVGGCIHEDGLEFEDLSEDDGRFFDHFTLVEVEENENDFEWTNRWIEPRQAEGD